MIVLLTACTDDEPARVAVPSSASTTTTTSTTPIECARPPFGLTWAPDAWLHEGGFLPGWEKGGGGGSEAGCTFHVGGDGRFVDVRAGDGGFSLGDEQRTITVLGRDAAVGPIHEGFMVQTATHALLGYGIAEDELARLAEGLYFTMSGVSVEERPIVDGTGIAELVELTANAVTFDPTAEHTGDDAIRELVERGFTEDDYSNDHFSVNDDPATQTLPLADHLVVTSPWVAYGSDGCELCQRVVTTEQVQSILGDDAHPQHAAVRFSPWWVTVVDGEVARLDQQYLP